MLAPPCQTQTSSALCCPPLHSVPSLTHNSSLQLSTCPPAAAITDAGGRSQVQAARVSGSVVGPWNDATPALAGTLDRLACVSLIVCCPRRPEGRQGLVTLLAL